MKLLKEKIEKLPKNAGVYIFKDRSNQIIYVGKANNLKNRVKSYFNKNISYRTKALLNEANNLEYIETKSEPESLILESQLIKKHQPKFNVLMRDDKNYFFVGITKERFPKIFITHQPRAKSQQLIATLIGPFTDGNSLKQTLKLLRRHIPYCTCLKPHKTPCLNSHINLCAGFCCIKNTTLDQNNIKDYNKNISHLKSILTGQQKNLLEGIQKEMAQTARNQNFERAAVLRDQIQAIENIFEHKLVQLPASSSRLSAQKSLSELKNLLNLKIVPKRIEGYDVANIQGLDATASMVVFINGKKSNKDYRQFKIRTKFTPDDVAMLKEVLIRRLAHSNKRDPSTKLGTNWALPNLIFIDGGLGQINTAQRILKSIKLNIPLISLAKGTNTIFIAKNIRSNKKTALRLKDLPQNSGNLILQIKDEAHRFARRYHHKLRDKIINHT